MHIAAAGVFILDCTQIVLQSSSEQSSRAPISGPRIYHTFKDERKKKQA